MTETPVSRLILNLGIPTTISMLITSIYNMADTYFVGTLGESAQAATGILFTVQAIMQGLAFMLGHGAGTHVSRSLADRDADKATMYISTSFFTGMGLGLVIGVLGLAFLRPLVHFLGSTDTIAPYAMDYGFWVFLAAPTIICSLILNNGLRYEGKAFYAMIGLTAGGLLNILGDYILVMKLGMGVYGAGLATAASQLVSFVILLIMYLKMAQSTIRFRAVSRNFKIYLSICRVGLPSLIRQGLTSVTMGLLNNMTKPFGDAAIAAMSVVNRYSNFLICVGLGIGQGFQPVCGFNYGARKYDRMHRAFSFSVKVTTIVLLVLGVAGFAFAEPVVTLFRRSDPEVIRIGTETFRVQILTVWTWGFITLSNMYTQAIGYGIRSTILAAARQGLFLIPTLLVLPNVWGLRGLEVCQPLADVLTLALAVWMMTKVIRTQKAQMAQETA